MTQEQQTELLRRAFKAVEQRLLPAKLAPTAVNGSKIVTALIERGVLQGTPDEQYEAVKSIYNQLEWVVKPAKLLAQEQNEKPRNQNDAVKDIEDRAAKVRAGEVAAAQQAADEASIKQAKSLIAGYTPTKTTPRGQVIDYADQTKSQEQWTTALNQAVATKQNLQEWVKALVATIQKRYVDRERASERI